MNKKLFEEGLRMERAGKLEDAALAYQRVVDADPGDQEAVGRLLVVYRRLKDYRRELKVIGSALGAVEERGKAARDKWLKAHPGAAKLGKEVLKKLGGESMTAYGTDPLVEKLLKRMMVLEKKTGKKVRGVKKVVVPVPKKVAVPKEVEVPKKVEVAKKVLTPKKVVAPEKVVAPKKVVAPVPKKVAVKKEEVVVREKEAEAQPSLFVVSFRYLAPLEKIDASMKKHVAFLDKHFAAGEFLVSGQQVPRRGGIIIARGKDRAAVERMMKQDPFVKGRLASVDIVEFVSSKVGKGLEGWIRGKKSILRHP
jgi:uncharacterized protein YciI